MRQLIIYLDSYSGMARPRKPIDPLGERQLLLETLQNQKPGWERERLVALKQALEG